MSTFDDPPFSLPPAQASFLDRCVASGRYASAGEVVRAGLRLLAHEEELRQAGLEKARQMIEAGARELDRGQGQDGQAVLRRLQARRERMQRDLADSQ